MSLVEKLTEIKRQKDEYILPENIKSGVKIYGITGAYEGGSGSSVKQFETEEEMNQDTTAQLNDIAVVYKSEIKNSNVNSTFQTVYFPQTVVLPSPEPDYIDVRLATTDGSASTYVFLYESAFEIQYGNGIDIMVRYTSSDGLTYNRTVFRGSVVSGDYAIFETPLIVSEPDYWSDNVGYFMQVSATNFSGVYTYREEDEKDYYSIPYNVDPVNKTYEQQNVNLKEFWDFLDTDERFNSWFKTYTNAEFDIKYLEIENKQIKRAKVYYSSTGKALSKVYYSELDQYALLENQTADEIYVADVDMENKTIVNSSIIPTILGMTHTSTSYYLIEMYEKTDIISECNSRVPHIIGTEGYWVTTNVGAEYVSAYTFNITREPEMITKWRYAKSQLNATPEYVYEKTFYGSNGVETGTLLNDIPTTLNDHIADLYVDLQNLYDNMDPLVLDETSNYRVLTRNISGIPVKSDGTPLLDCGNIVNATQMFTDATKLCVVSNLNLSSANVANQLFYNCYNLAYVHNLDLKNSTTGYYTFMNCTNLHSLDTVYFTNKLRHTEGMFCNCSNLSVLPNITNAELNISRHMFCNCRNLPEAPMLNTSGVYIAYAMFENCYKITNVPLYDTQKIYNSGYMFANCINLRDVPQFNSKKFSEIDAMFSGCNNLSDASIQNIINMCLNSNIATRKNLNTSNYYSPFRNTNITSDRYSNRLSELSSAGWSY